jgi:hypothetical protein
VAHSICRYVRPRPEIEAFGRFLEEANPLCVLGPGEPAGLASLARSRGRRAAAFWRRARACTADAMPLARRDRKTALPDAWWRTRVWRTKADTSTAQIIGRRIAISSP